MVRTEIKRRKSGQYDAANQSNTHMFLPVMDGDVVLIPSAVWLLGSGLIGLAGFKKKYKK